MSLNPPGIADCPLLLGSDALSLPGDHIIQGHILHDTALGGKHTIHPSGKHIIEPLRAGTTFICLRRLAKARDITDDQLYGLLGALNTVGALRRKRTPKQHIHACLVRAKHRLCGICHAPLTWRAPANRGAVAVALSRACWPIAIGSVMVCCVAVMGGLSSLSAAAAITAPALSLFWTSLFVHEMAHIRLVSRRGSRPVILQRGLRLGIVHRPLPWKREMRAAIAGPVAGIAFCCTAALLYALLDRRTMAWLCLFVGGFHIGSLLPWYGDGATLMTALTKRRTYAQYRKVDRKAQ